MTELDYKTLLVLGRQPVLGLAEAERLYGSELVKPFGEVTLVGVDPENIDYRRLGGTIKAARLISYLPGSSWRDIEQYLITNIPKKLEDQPQGKLTLGLSVHGMRITAAQINKSLLAIKKVVKKSGRPIRVVPNVEAKLSSAQVLHNKLLLRGGWELIIAVHGNRAILAQTIFVQDIEAYAARDQARPARDARVGMLPPKLAQIMLNLAAGSLDFENLEKEDRSSVRILDPFCGTGVVLQEAMMMGYSVLGTDLEPRMVEYSRTNLAWLISKYPQLTTSAKVDVADATSNTWSGFLSVVSETYLGRPLSSLPDPDKLQEIIQDVNTILEKFLKNLLPQINSNNTICLAVPAWRKSNNVLVHLPLIDRLSDLGYNYVDFKHVSAKDLVYYRETQLVARQLLVLRKK